MIKKVGLIFTALLMVGLLSAPSAVRADDSHDTTAIKWSVDYDARTITVTVKLGFFTCTVAEYAESKVLCDGYPGQEETAAITDAITTAWNNHRFKCFDFVVKVNSSWHVSQAQVDNTSVNIQLAHGMRADNPAYTITAGDSSHTRNTAPGSGVVPKNYRDDPAEWEAVSDPSTYIHEFGHILGLDDNYQDDPANGHHIPGTTDDAMFGNGPHKAEVSQDMVDRVILRSEKVDVDKVKCAMSMDVPSTSVDIFGGIQLTDFTLHAYTCDYDPITTDPKKPPKAMHFTGSLSYFGNVWEGALDPLTEGGGSGVFPFEFDVTVPSNTVPASGTGHAKFTVGENLTFENDFAWTGDGLIHQLHPWVIAGAPSEIIPDIGGGNFALNAVVTRDAPECTK